MGARRRWTSVTVLVALHVGALAATAQGPVPVDLPIEMRDLARVPPEVMRETKAEVDRTFRASGVRTVWVGREASPQSPKPLTVYVVGGTSAGPSNDASGATVVGLAPPSGTWAQVFYRRVSAAVADRQVPISVVLAHVISHELGHLLLPPASHAPFGIMRRAVDLEHPALRRFTDEQSRQIRAAVASGQRYWSRCDH